MNGHVRAIVPSVVVLTCAFVVVLTATASRGASSSPTSRATNGLIAYQAWVGKHPHKHFQIFTVQPDGTHVHQLTHFDDNLSQFVGSGAESPDWSPDGRKIIFTRHWGDYPGPQSFQLLTMNADGSAMRAVTPRGLDERASYLPDGRILYYRGGSRVWVVANPDATHIRSTGIHQRFASLCVLPNGNRIALRRSLKVHAQLGALFVGRLFGGPDRLKRITRYQRMDATIDCSADGTRILFSSGHDFGSPESSNVFSVRTDGGGLVQLTRSQGGSVNNDAASWSPDGTKIVFIRYRNRSKLYVMDADGTAVTQLTHGPEGVGAAAWGNSQAQTGGKVKVRIAGRGPKNGKDVTNGDVVGRGHFTATGAITDQGTAVTYRTVKGNLAAGNAVITLRFVTTGKKGAITFLVKIVVKPTTTTSRWTISSGTKAYEGLSGKGTERENADHTVVTMTGTVSR
jgi:hypothetical protein